MMLSLACAFGAALGSAHAQAPARIVSANLCADQLVLALADPEQILSLGPFARDETLSYLHRAAAKYPLNRGSAEEVIGLKAGLVLLGSFDSRYARAVLERQRIPFMTLEPWTDMEQGRHQIRDVARRLGQRERGEAMIAQIDAGIARLRGIAENLSRKATALVLHRRGYALHSGIAAELAGIAGLENASAQVGIGSDGIVPIERIVAHPPDMLIVTQDHIHPADQGEALLAHPALARLFPAEKRLIIPDLLAICAGPSTPELIEKLAAEISAKVR